MADEKYSLREYLTPVLGIVAILSEIAYTVLDWHIHFSGLPLGLLLLGLLGGLAWKGQSLNENLDPLLSHF